MDELKTFLMGVCILPGLYDVAQVAVFNKDEFDIVLLFILFLCAMAGSSVQITHKNLKRAISKKEILAIYVTAPVMAMMGYAASMYVNGNVWVFIGTIFGSFMSLELFAVTKKAIVGIVSWLPEAFKEYMRHRYGGSSDNEDVKKKWRPIITVFP